MWMSDGRNRKSLPKHESETTRKMTCLFALDLLHPCSFPPLSLYSAILAYLLGFISHKKRVGRGKESLEQQK